MTAELVVHKQWFCWSKQNETNWQIFLSLSLFCTNKHFNTHTLNTYIIQLSIFFPFLFCFFVCLLQHAHPRHMISPVQEQVKKKKKKKMYIYWCRWDRQLCYINADNRDSNDPLTSRHLFRAPLWVKRWSQWHRSFKLLVFAPCYSKTPGINRWWEERILIWRCFIKQVENDQSSI